MRQRQGTRRRRSAVTRTASASRQVVCRYHKCVSGCLPTLITLPVPKWIQSPNTRSHLPTLIAIPWALILSIIYIKTPPSSTTLFAPLLSTAFPPLLPSSPRRPLRRPLWPTDTHNDNQTVTFGCMIHPLLLSTRTRMVLFPIPIHIPSLLI